VLDVDRPRFERSSRGWEFGAERSGEDSGAGSKGLTGSDDPTLARAARFEFSWASERLLRDAGFYRLSERVERGATICDWLTAGCGEQNEANHLSIECHVQTVLAGGERAVWNIGDDESRIRR
jgi:hypothetical protein